MSTALMVSSECLSSFVIVVVVVCVADVQLQSWSVNADPGRLPVPKFHDEYDDGE